MIKTVVVADDHPIFLLGLKTLLTTTYDEYQVVGEAASTDDLVEVLRCTKPDILITDFSMPSVKHPDGLPLMRYIRKCYPDMAIIVVTMITNPSILMSIAKIGVHATLSKSNLSNELKNALKNINHPPRKVDKVDYTPVLTPKESEVIRLLVKGYCVNQISKQLHRTKQTISAQKYSAMKKLGVSTEIELFQYAILVGLNN
jgi:two-component system capsular synthesis response regulator RcsB